jgi:hypothetical protein
VLFCVMARVGIAGLGSGFRVLFCLRGRQCLKCSSLSSFCIAFLLFFFSGVLLLSLSLSLSLSLLSLSLSLSMCVRVCT